MTKILLVEDDKALRMMTTFYLESQGYKVEAVENGRFAIEAFDANLPDLIVSDIAMPEMNGFELLEGIRKREAGAGMPFLFVSAFSENESVARARRLGVDDYLFKPFDVQDLRDAIEIRLARRRTLQMVDTREAHLQTVTMLANSIEARDIYTRGHVERVRNYARTLAQALEWDDAAMVTLEFGAILHDVGKVSIPDHILNKPGPLTPEEKVTMHAHAEIGTRMMKDVTHLEAALPYILHHHERWDGEGYPNHLMHDEIPMEGRLLALTDAYDAMTTDRPYRKGMPKEDALKRLKIDSGKHFDPVMVDAFVEIMAV